MSNVAKVSRAERLRALTGGMRLPLVAAPMFLVSGPGLVLAACRAGIAAAFPTPNARSIAILEGWRRGAEAPQVKDPREAGRLWREMWTKVKKNSGMDGLPLD